MAKRIVKKTEKKRRKYLKPRSLSTICAKNKMRQNVMERKIMKIESKKQKQNKKRKRKEGKTDEKGFII